MTMAQRFVEGQSPDDIAEGYPYMSAGGVTWSINDVSERLLAAQRDRDTRIDLDKAFETGLARVARAALSEAVKIEAPMIDALRRKKSLAPTAIKKQTSALRRAAKRIAIDDSTYEQWLADRETNRSVLFGNTQDISDTTSLSALTRAASPLPTPTTSERSLRCALARISTAVLEIHDSIARTPSKGRAAFGIVRPEENLERIAGLTAHTLWNWERAWNQHKKRSDLTGTQGSSPFANLSQYNLEDIDFAQTDIQLVIETAAAICEILEAGYPSSRSDTLHNLHNQNLARFIAKHGPNFAAKWVRGDIIRAHCEQHGFDSDHWLWVIPPARRATIGIDYNDPLSAAARIVEKYDAELSDESMSAILQLTVDEVQEAFPSGIRKQLLATNLRTPASVFLRSYNTLLGTTLSTAELSKLLHWPAQRVDDTFTRSNRIKAALGSPRHPTVPIERAAKKLDMPAYQPESFAKHLGWSIAEARAIFTLPVRRNLAMSDKNFADEILRISGNYESLSDPANVARYLNISEKEAISLTPKSIKKYLAAHSDPWQNLKNRKRTADRIRADCPDLEPEIVALILHIPADVKQLYGRALLIQAHMHECPRHIKRTLWGYTIYRNPEGDPHTWRQSAETDLAAYRQWLQTQAPSRHSGKQNGEAYDKLERQRTTNDTALEPSMLLLPSDALERLQGLAAQAGLSEEDLEGLLEFMATQEETEHEN